MMPTSISAPVLTSTSNMAVAQDAGIPHNPITHQAFHESHERTSDENVAYQARSLAKKIETGGPKSYKKNQLNRLGAAIKGRFGKGQGSYSQLQEEDTSAAVRKNLCNDKIKDLTGNGKVPRRTVIASPTTATLNNIDAEAETDPLLSKPRSQEYLSVPTDFQDDDSQFGSLSRSFNSAVEKLNQVDTDADENVGRDTVQVS